MRLEGQSILVLGGGQMPGETIGNGRATSIAFAREGAHVVVADLHLERAAETVADIESEGFRAEAIQADVTDEDACRRAIGRTLELCGQLDVLHYNVGIAGGDAPAHALSREGWDRMLEVNTTGFFLSAKHALPAMRRQGKGTILAVSSIAAMWTFGTTVAYKCSKAAMNAFVQSTAVSNAKYGIRVNAILPGLMDTPIAIESTHEATGRPRTQIREDLSLIHI